MIRHTFGMMVLAATVLAGTAAAAETTTNPPLRLEIELVDGSRIIGTPDITAVPVQTVYAKMSIPLKQILAVTMEADHETASFEMQNGDKLKGVVDLGPLHLATLFGKVTIPFEHIRTLRVSLSGGSLPGALRKGLVLHYSFDRDEGSVVADKSPERNTGTVYGARWTAQGKVGGACEFDGGGSYIAVKPRTDLSGTGDFTVSLWTCAQRRSPQIDGSGVSGERQYILDTHSDAVSGQYRPGFCLIYDFKGSDTGEIHNGILFDMSENGITEQNTRVDVADKWHHLVFVRRGTEDYTYLDGRLLDSTYGRRVQRNDLLDLNHTWSIGTFAGNNHPGSRSINYSFKGRMDEVMVFNRALSADEARQIFDTQK